MAYFNIHLTIYIIIVVSEVKWLNNIKSEANRMNILIKNLLELASFEKKETYVLKEDNLSKVVELAVLTFDAKAY